MINSKRSWSWILLGFLAALLIVLASVFVIEVHNLRESTTYLNYVEYANANTQRLIKLALEDKDSAKVIFYLDDTMTDSLTYHTIFQTEEQQEFISFSQVMIADWNDVKDILSQPILDEEALYYAGERHFYHTTDLSLKVTNYIDNLSDHIIVIEFLLLLNIILVCAIIARNLWKTHKELHKSRALVREKSLDMATGLYNRSKCQEVLKTAVNPHDHKALVIFDLNDLKKVNDQLGHRAGDEMIASFAEVLKESINVHRDPPFLGRYGGDEFVVFYQNIEESEVQLFLKEVAVLSDHFNLNSQHYKLSYAAGYAISTAEKKHPTMRLLFDEADQAMYVNKIAVKKARAEGGTAL